MRPSFAHVTGAASSCLFSIRRGVVVVSTDHTVYRPKRAEAGTEKGRTQTVILPPMVGSSVLFSPRSYRTVLEHQYVM